MPLLIHTIIALLIFSTSLQATEFDLCNDTVIDDETEYAYGPHGIPYTGEILCYRDNEKKSLKSKRAFNEGKPIGRHICYNTTGDKGSFISYNNTGVKKHGFFAPKTENVNKFPYAGNVICNSETPSICTAEWECSKDAKYCYFSCR